MDFQLERFEGSLAGRTLYRAENGLLRAVQAPAETRLVCSECRAVVARNVPDRGILRRVFECARCGARNIVGRTTPNSGERDLRAG
jgi:hypothetical protein